MGIIAIKRKIRQCGESILASASEFAVAEGLFALLISSYDDDGDDAAAIVFDYAGLRQRLSYADSYDGSSSCGQCQR